MKEIELGRQGKYRGMVALVDDSDFDYLNQFKWCAMKHRNRFYVNTKIRVDGKEINVYMHSMIMGRKWIDHIDGNGCNNTRSNLRFCTPSENGMNKQKKENTSSIYKGVHFFKRAKKWQAYITINRKRIHLGYFDAEAEAAKAYNAKAIELFCEFANLNIVSNE